MYEEEIESAEEELKRADHLVYVSLKYTRTCDIMKNAIKRMINAYELSTVAYLEKLKKSKKIKAVPKTAKERATLAKNLLGSSCRKYFTLYNLLKKINKADYAAREEFRKNVTLIAKLTKPVEIKVLDLYDYLEITRDFVSYLDEKIRK